MVVYCLTTLTQYPLVFAQRDYGTVFDLAVTKRCRRKGIGDKLYRAAETFFLNTGAAGLKFA